MKILVTGAAGLLGGAVASAMQAAGHQVTALDRAKTSLHSAPGRAQGMTLLQGDILDQETLARAVRDQDAVFHGAAILAPASERDPARARAVNVEGTRRLLAATAAEAERQRRQRGPWPSMRPGIIYPSSVALWGPGDPDGAPRCSDDPIQPSDHYTSQKAEAETMVRASGLPWLVFRVGVVMHPGQIVTNPEIIAWMFEVRPANRIEILHPEDAGRAVLNAIEEPRAWNRILPLGGGPACQVRQQDLLEAAFQALGLGPLPPGIQGREPFYTDWMDSSETERLLRYQRYSFADFRRESAARYRWLRPGLGALAPIIRRALVAWMDSRRHHVSSSQAKH